MARTDARLRRTSRLRLEWLESRDLPSALSPGLLRPDVGQVFYLDFDGAAGVSYDGPVSVRDIVVPPFRAPYRLAGQEAAIKAVVQARLNERFASLGATFLITPPSEA